jgi:ribosomal protein S27AE
LRIKEMFLAGERLSTIGKRLGMTALEVHDIVERLKLKQLLTACPVCGWQGKMAGHTPSVCARKLLIRSLSESGMRASAIARTLGVSRNLISLTTRRLTTMSSTAKAESCPVCGWGGVMSFHNAERCAFYLEVRQMREAGLPWPEIFRELDISRGSLFHARRRMGSTSSKPPK